VGEGFEARVSCHGDTAEVDVIVTDRLTKRYGADRGVIDLSFSVVQGEVFGYLGPNGAGKTTTIRLLLDLVRPTSGGARVLGLDPRRDGRSLRARLGVVPGDLRLYERLTGREVLTYFSALRGRRLGPEADALAERLDADLSRTVRTLSKGNRQKIGLIQALAHRPELLVLDEPTSGLDPLVQEQVLGLLREAAADGRTVFLSSHALSEVQRTADRVGVLREGRLELVEDVDSLRARALSRVVVSFAQTPPVGSFDGLPGVRETERHGTVVGFTLDGPADPLVKALARYEVVGLDSHEADLEDVFLALYRKRDDAR
jgi:ABC-2 type transport system ATP-binding protein